MARCGCISACSCVFSDTVMGDCVDITVGGSGSSTDPYIVTADLIIDPDSNTCLVCGADGLNLVFDPATANCLNCGPSGIRLVINPIGTNKLSCSASGLLVTASENPFITVAAADTPAPYKAAATFICDGTADDVEINAAIAAATAAGGVSLVFLLQGQFTLAATVTLNNGDHLIGAGARETLIITAVGITPFTITGGQGNIIEGVRINTNTAPCVVQTAGGSETVLRNNIFDTATSNGASSGQVHITTGNLHRIHDNLFATNNVGASFRSVHLIAAQSKVYNNFFQSGSVFYQGSNSDIYDNNILFSTLDAFTFFTSDEIRVDGNNVELTFGHGYLIDTTEDSMFTNNFVSHFDAANGGGAGAATHDGFHLVTSLRNQVTNNYARNNPGAAFGRYGINVNGAANNGNWVTNNDLRAGNVLAAFNDTGTATDITAGNRLV